MDAAITPSAIDRDVYPEMSEQTIASIMRMYMFSGINALQNYGWYILGATLVWLYVWSKISPYIYKWLKDKEDREFSAKYHKDPDLIFKRQEALEIARLRLEQKYEADAARAAEKRKELEEKKRQEWLQRQNGNSHPGRRLNEDFDNGSISTDGSDESGTKKKPGRLKSDYNPLMGGGSRGYRPSRRSLCPSGGCG